MPFEFNRIDGTPALPLLRPDRVSVRGDEAMIELGPVRRSRHRVILPRSRWGGRARV